MNSAEAINTANGVTLWRMVTTGERGGKVTMYAAGGTKLHGRELWCYTQKDALANAGAANVGPSV